MYALPPQDTSSMYEVQTPSSEASAFIFKSLADIKRYNNFSCTFQSIEDRFNSLMLTWKQDTLFLSSLNEICSNKSYLQIIAMGQEVLPMIFKSMSKDPAYWFVALNSITGGIDPIKLEHRGNLAQMTEDWLNWAQKNNYYVAR